MHLKVKRCCFYCPLRWGIILFGFINMIFSLLAVGFLVYSTERQKTGLPRVDSLQAVASTVLYAIFGMGVILNILLLAAGYQKDASMLRLYNFYAVATTLAAMVPTSILMSRLEIPEVCAVLLAIVMQLYVILLVNSEIEKLKEILPKTNEDYTEQIVDVYDRETLV